MVSASATSPEAKRTAPPTNGNPAPTKSFHASRPQEREAEEHSEQPGREREAGDNADGSAESGFAHESSTSTANRWTLSRVKLRAQRSAEAVETPKLRTAEDAGASRRPAAAS